MENKKVKNVETTKNTGVFEDIEHDEKARVIHFVYEAQLERMDGIVKKLFILCLILIMLLFGSNAAWIMSSSSNSVQTSYGNMNSTEKIMALKPLHVQNAEEDETENEDLQDKNENELVIIRHAGVLAVAC